MAQHFLNLGFQKPFSGELPHALANITGNPSPFINSRTAGSVWGYGEYVYQLEMLPDDSPINASTSIKMIEGLTQADILIKYTDRTPTGGTGNSDFSFGIHVIDNTINEHHLYIKRTNDAALAKTAEFMANNNATIESSFFGSAFRLGEPRYIRLNFTASTIRAKGWNFTEAEPSNWSAEKTSGVTIASSYIRIKVFQGGQVADLHWLAYSDVAATPAYKASVPASDTTDLPSGSRTITVTVTDAQGQPVDQATVSLYHQATGMFVDGTITSSDGVATFYVETEDLFYAIAHDAITAQVGNVKTYSYNFLNE